jgi:V/A-type H+-transporting ATPase subunit A
MVEHFTGQVSPHWDEQHRYCREILQREETLREVAEIVGIEGLQDADRLLMKTAERLRQEFLSQNAYTDDAFSTPEQTSEKIGAILDFHDRAEVQLREGALLDDVLKKGK